MTVASILQQTSDAKIAHLRWVKRAEHLISGLPIKEDFIPLEPTSCVFGKWFYSQGSQLRTVDSLKDTMAQIEKHHDELHDTYGEIYKIYFLLPQHRSLLHKILTFNSKEVTPDEQKEAKNHYQHLKQTSDTLLFFVEQLEKKVKELNYQDLKFDT